MRRHRYISVLFSLLLTACINTAGNEEEVERLTIQQLILLRTEGLILAEIVHQHTKSEEIKMMSRKIISYYKDTHPNFLTLCTGKSVEIEEQDFDSLWNRTNHFLRIDSNNMEKAFMSLCLDHIGRSIALHEFIIQDIQWEDISYFSFLALPDLYNQQEELKGLENKIGIKLLPGLQITTHPHQ